MEKTIELKRAELERQGRKLLKDIEFLHRATEQRLQEERLTEEIKLQLDDNRMSPKGDEVEDVDIFNHKLH